MAVKNQRLHRRIMYRVYASFVLSLAEHRFFWKGFLFGGALALFGRLVHVAAIANNVLATPLGSLPQYVYGSIVSAATDGKFLIIMTLLIMATIGVSFVRAFVRLTLAGAPRHA